MSEQKISHAELQELFPDGMPIEAWTITNDAPDIQIARTRLQELSQKLTTQAGVKDIFYGGVYNVDQINENQFQSVFPHELSDLSAIHDTEAEAWKYILSEVVKMQRY